MVSPQEKPLVFESAWKKEKDVVAKEMEKLRASIQTLCRSALPLGKVMDYLQEDVDAMQRELQLWRGERQQHAEALRAEQRSVRRPPWCGRVWAGHHALHPSCQNPKAL